MTETVNKDGKLAAGGIVLDSNHGGEPRVLIIHRPRYNDWSLPKGGVEPNESLEDAALREVREETGIECRIGREIAVLRYPYRTRKGNIKPKAVHYFLMEPLATLLVVDGDEVDMAEWVSIDEAKKRLSYKGDKEMLDNLTVDR